MKTKLLNLFICTITVCSLLMNPLQIFAEEEPASHQSTPDFKNIPIVFVKMEKDQVPVRVAPDFDSEVIERIKIGVYLPVLPNEGSMYKVWIPSSGQQGYVSLSDVSVLDPSRIDTFLFHQVIPGDTLSKIAETYKTSLKALIEINHLNPEKDILVGQSLIIPRGTPDELAVLKTDKIPDGFYPIDKTVGNYNPIDINNHWAYTQLDDLLNADILNGIKNHQATELKPNKQITRAEFVTIIIRALGLEHTELTNQTTFIDVKPNDWFYRFIQIACDKGIVTGINEKIFAPNQFIRRDEITAIIARAFENTIDFNDGTPISFHDVHDYWAKTFIDKASSVGIITGDAANSFKPGRYATRAEAVTMLYRALQMEKSDLPTENLLIEHVLHELSEIDWYLQYGDNNMPRNRRTYNMLKRYIEENVTGYYQKYLYQQVADYEGLYEKSIVPMFTLRGPETVAVIHRSNRFATVEIKGANYDVHLSGEGLRSNRDFSLDASGILLLKRMSDGTWKSYMFLPNKPNHHLIEGIVDKTEALLKTNA